MTRHFAALAAACLVTTGFAAAAGEIAPTSGHSIYLDHFTGTVFYTAEADGYRVVATLSSGAEAAPVRFVSTLVPGQRMLISVPQGAGEPSIDFELVREGAALVVHEPADYASGAEAGDPVIELLIAACLAHGECRDFALLYDAREVSLTTCVAKGQIEVARWQASHPGWSVERWRCGFPDSEDSA